MDKGYIQIYTGYGKGKTTAAIGLAIRAVGAGMKVWIGQFLKCKECSEHKALERYSDSITLRKFGKGFIYDKPSENDVRTAHLGLEEIEIILTRGEHQMVILDEVCLACSIGLFSVEKLTGIIKLKPLSVELILTGRDAPEELIELADLVTEMKEIKHYYRSGVSSRRGIEE
jgi:cob(I)alamin adenosyltransferase